MFGRGSVKSDSLNQHKSLAMGKIPCGCEDVKPFPTTRNAGKSKPVGSTRDSSNRMGKL